MCANPLFGFTPSMWGTSREGLWESHRNTKDGNICSSSQIVRSMKMIEERMIEASMKKASVRWIVDVSQLDGFLC
jgi:hypothetical protein